MPHMGLRRGLCNAVVGAETSGNNSEDENNLLSTSLEAKYFSRGQEDADDLWNLCPDNMVQEFQRGRFHLFIPPSSLPVVFFV